MRSEILKILETAVNAPSGENTQPWRFKVNDDQVLVYNIPERDQSLYNTGQKGSYVAHGALLENIQILATSAGFDIKIVISPNQNDINLTAKIIFQKSYPKNEPLAEWIPKRTTNRKPYDKKSLDTDQLNELKNISTEEGEVIFITDPSKVSLLAHACSTNERVMFANKSIHNFFFRHINWTKDEENKKRIGFYIKTLEAPPPAQILFKVLKRWWVMRVFNVFGLSTLIAGGNAQTYASSSAMGIVLANKNTPEDMIAAGRIMQSIGLKATQMGISVQPLTGVIFFMQAILAGRTEEFSKKHIELIKKSYNQIRETFNAGDKTPAMLFRLGYDGEPTAHSMKLNPYVITD